MIISPLIKWPNLLCHYTKTKAGTWKAIIRRAGWPNVSKTFRVKRDAENWSRTTEDEIIRGIYVPRNNSEKMTVAAALDRYIKEVTPIKKAGTQRREIGRAQLLKERLGQLHIFAYCEHGILRSVNTYFHQP